VPIRSDQFETRRPARDVLTCRAHDGVEAPRALIPSSVLCANLVGIFDVWSFSSWGLDTGMPSSLLGLGKEGWAGIYESVAAGLLFKR
jgi:hypothetical protein